MKYGLLALCAVLVAGCGKSEPPPAPPPTPSLQDQLADMYTAVRTAFAEYRLDDAMPYLQIPADEPRPTREQAAMVADFLPDLATARILDFAREGDVAGMWVDTSADPESTEVTILRFQRIGGAWKIHAPPHSASSVSVEKTDEAGIRKLIETEESLRLIPE